MDLPLVLSSRFELTTLSRKAAVGFRLHFNEKFALLGGEHKSSAMREDFTPRK